VTPVVAASLTALSLTIPVGVLTDHLVAAYDSVTAALVVVLTSPDVLDSPVMRGIDERWLRRRERRRRAKLPAARARHAVRLSRFGWFLRNSLIVLVPLVALGLFVAAIGGVVAVFGYPVVANVGLTMAGAAAIPLVLLFLVAALVPTRSPEEKLLDGYLTSADVAAALGRWHYRKPLAVVLVLLGSALSAIFGI
jgi:hypothetical protein